MQSLTHTNDEGNSITEDFVMLDIKITPTTAPKAKPQTDKLGFGKIFTDHMFIMNYTEGKGWHDPRIVPYAPISLDPAAMVFHYGQEMFEGLKAYRTADGSIQLFRPQKNIERMNNTNRPMMYFRPSRLWLNMKRIGFLLLTAPPSTSVPLSLLPIPSLASTLPRPISS